MTKYRFEELHRHDPWVHERNTETTREWVARTRRQAKVIDPVRFGGSLPGRGVTVRVHRPVEPL